MEISNDKQRKAVSTLVSAAGVSENSVMRVLAVLQTYDVAQLLALLGRKQPPKPPKRRAIPKDEDEAASEE